MDRYNKTICKHKIIEIIATIICVISPLIATLLMFPIWVNESSKATVSGLFLVFLYLSCLPFTRQIKQYFKNPSAWVVWFVLFVLFYIVKCIIMQMLIISAAGLVGNLIGVALYKFANHIQLKRNLSVFDKEKTASENNGNGE